LEAGDTSSSSSEQSCSPACSTGLVN
jgi:hypothetical protein